MTMKKMMFSILIAITGCTVHSTAPTARLTAARMFAEGKSCAQIATKFHTDREHARELIRTGMADLYKIYSKDGIVPPTSENPAVADR
jgi:hypothetical protein